MIKVSVLIPVFNQEELIIKALDSIPKRDDIEIIVCDDGSTDLTYQKVDKYKRVNNKNIILFDNEQNKGVAYAVNRLYDKAKGEYIVLLGSDDYFYTDEFERAIEELDGTDLIYFQTTNNYGMVELNEHNKVGSFKFVRREFLGNIRNDEFRLAGEDYHMYKELLKKNPTEKYLDLIVKHYNYPREGSLNWKLNNGIIDLETGKNTDRVSD